MGKVVINSSENLPNSREFTSGYTCLTTLTFEHFVVQYHSTTQKTGSIVIYLVLLALGATNPD